MRGLDGTVAEVLLHPEQVDPTFRNREADTDVLTGNLTILPA